MDRRSDDEPSASSIDAPPEHVATSSPLREDLEQRSPAGRAPRTAVTAQQPGRQPEVPPPGDVLVSGREREPRARGPLGVALGLALLAAAGGAALWTVHSGTRAAPPAPARPDRATAAPTTAAPTSAARTARPRDTDLATTVSVGQVSIPPLGVDEQIALVSQQLQGSGVEASYRLRPDAAGDGVRVQFDRRLSASSATAFRSALRDLPGAAVDLHDVPGTTVDVTVPATAGYTCVPEFFQPQAVLDTLDLDVVSDAFGIFGLGFAAGTVTVSYTGPLLSPAALQAVRAALAHSCGTSPAQVSLLRRDDAR